MSGSRCCLAVAATLRHQLFFGGWPGEGVFGNDSTLVFSTRALVLTVLRRFKLESRLRIVSVQFSIRSLMI